MLARKLSVVLLVLTTIHGAAAPRVDGACNVIPSLERIYPSSLAAVDVPFAQPGKIVTVSRPDAVFSDDPLGNVVTVTFRPLGGPETVVGGLQTLPPLDGSTCPTSACNAGLCTCARFAFPDTDAQMGVPNDGRPLTGPATIVVTTSGVTTADIGPLIDRSTGTTNAFVPEFVALPPAIDFAALTGTPGADVLGAADSDGNLFVPVSYASTIQLNRSQLVETTIPGLGLIPDAVLDSLTPEGAILPPFVQRVGAQNLLGSVDAPEVVLRLAHGQTLLGLSAIDDKGPIVISGVDGYADPQKNATVAYASTSRNTMVFEAHECGPFDDPLSCGDLNNDGDTRDYFLKLLDLTTPQATPILVDEVDGATLPGFPASMPPWLYAAQVTDQLVAFRAVDGGFDADGNGSHADVLRTGAYDVTRQTRVALADDSPRIAIDGGVLAFSVPEDPVNGPDRTYVYDVDQLAPGPVGLVDLATAPSGELLPIMRTSDYTDLLGTLAIPFMPQGEVDLALASGLVGGVVDETALGIDTNDDGTIGGALTFFDLTGTTVSSSFRFTQAGIVGRPLQMNERWILFEFLFGFTERILVVDRTDPFGPSQTICEGPNGATAMAGRMSTTIVPCARHETGFLGQSQDLNGDGDTNDLVLHIFLPSDPAGPTEIDLGLATSLVGHAIGRLYFFPVDEVAQSADLDGDGIVGPPPGEPTSIWPVLHVFNAATKRTTNFRIPTVLLGNAAGVERGFGFVGGSVVDQSKLRLYFLRDLDADDSFEDIGTDVATGHTALNDNCSRVFNPDQADGDGDGIGDVCDPVVDVPVVGKQLTIIDKVASNGQASVGYGVSDKNAGITKGPGTDPADVAVEVRISYPGASGAATGRFTVPPGAYDGTAGWKSNKPSVAQYGNKAAPAGATAAKLAQIKPGKALKLVGKGLGDVPVDITAAGAPVGPIVVQYRVTSGGVTWGHCTAFDPADPLCKITYQSIAGGAGRKLVAKNGRPIVCP